MLLMNLNSVRILCLNFFWISLKLCKTFIQKSLTEKWIFNAFPIQNCELKWMHPSTRMSVTILIIYCYRRQNISLEEGILNEITQKRNAEFHSAWIVRGICYGFINGQDIQKSSDKKITHIVWALPSSFHSMVKRAFGRQWTRHPNETLLSEFLSFDSFIILKFEIDD